MNVRPADVIALEGNAAKNEVRNEIIAQLIERRDRLDEAFGREPADLCCLTLPGITFLFEQSLTTLYQHAYGGKVKLDCCEISPSRFAIASRRVPLNCELYLKPFEKMPAGAYDMLWADYCSTPTADQIDSAVLKAATTAKGSTFLYITVCLHHRVGGSETLCRNVRSRYRDPHKAVLNRVEFMLNKHAQRWRKIYDVRYAGGRNGSTGMLTVGYSVNPYGNRILATPIIADRRTAAGYRAFKRVQPRKKSRRRAIKKQVSDETKRILFFLKVRLTTQEVTPKEALEDDEWRIEMIRDMVDRIGCTSQKARRITSCYLRNAA
jgi:hypothetical protein